MIDQIKEHAALAGMLMLLFSLPTAMVLGTWAFWALLIGGCLVLVWAMLSGKAYLMKTNSDAIGLAYDT